MDLNLSIDAIITGGSALLFVLFGLYLVIVRPRDTGPRLVGPLAIGFGAQQVMFNFFPFSDPSNASAQDAILFSNIVWLTMVILCAGLLTARLDEFGARTWPRRNGLIFVASAVVVGLVTTPTFYWNGVLGRAELPSLTEGLWKIAFEIAMASLAILVLAIAWIWPDANRAARGRLLGLGLAFGLYVSWWGGRNAAMLATAESETILGSAILALIGLACICVWIRAAIKVGSTSAWWAAGGVILANASGWFTHLAAPDPIGMAGLARIAGLALLALATFRWGLLGETKGAPAVKTGSMVTYGAAAFLAVAQVVQNLVSDAAGLFWGAVAAMMMVLALRPLERLAQTPPTGGVDPEAAKSSYRSAVRLVLRDRVLSRGESRELAQLASSLRLAPDDAASILDDERRRSRGKRTRG